MQWLVSFYKIYCMLFTWQDFIQNKTHDSTNYHVILYEHEQDAVHYSNSCNIFKN